MIRLVVDIVVGLNALGAIVGFTIRRARRSRHDRVDESILRIEAENRRLDELNQKIGGGR